MIADYVAFDKQNRGDTSKNKKIGKVIVVKLIQLCAMVSIHLDNIYWSHNYHFQIVIYSSPLTHPCFPID